MDLPRFLNRDPEDVRSRAREAVSRVAAAPTVSDDPTARDATTELQRLGGAALPYVLPLLEALPPEARGRVAAALAPVAERMGLAAPGAISQPEAAALFWTRFWDDRALDYARSAVGRAITRLLNHGSDVRERDLMELDTFALPELMARDGVHDGRDDPRAASHSHRPPRHRTRPSARDGRPAGRGPPRAR